MPFARFALITRFAASASMFVMLTLSCWAQESGVAAPTPQASSDKALPVLNYAKPASHFPNPIAPYVPRHLPAPNLSNTARIDQLMHDGKLYLSLNDAIALALRTRAPIFVEDRVIDHAKTVDFASDKADAERLHKWLESLDPDDMGKYKM